MASSPFPNDIILIAGPSFHIDLAPLDARHPVHYSRRLLIFRCSSPAQRNAQLTALKIGVQALVSRCPILGGIVVPLPPDVVSAGQGLEDWRTIVPDRGIELTVRDLRMLVPSFEELEAAGFPSHQLPYDLFMPGIPQDLDNDRPFAACKMQFSVIDGGTILTFAMSHSIADGSATNELLRVLSDETRLAQENSSKSGDLGPKDATMGQDRSLLRNITSDIIFNIDDHPAFRLDITPSTNEPPPEQAHHHPFEATSPEIPVSLRISAAGLAQLKADATAPLAEAPPISTHDALSALIWRTTLLIRSRRSKSAKDVPASTMSSIFLPSDARRHLNLPASYVGNAVYQLTASQEIGAILSSSGLQHAAAALRRAIKAVKPELVASYMAELKERWIDWQFMAGSLSTTGVAMGTDWTSGVLYSADWGKAFGPLVKYRFPGEAAFNCIMPKLPDGSAEVVFCAMPEEVELVRRAECFGKYIEAT